MLEPEPTDPGCILRMPYSVIRFAIIFVCLFLGSRSSLLYAAQSEQETKQQLIQLQTEIKDIEKDIGIIEAKKRSALIQLGKIERQYGKVITNVRKLRGEVARQQDRLRQLTREKAAEARKSQKQLKALSSQLRSAHAAGRQDKLKFLLNQDNPTRASRMVVYYDYFNHSRLSHLEIISEKLQNLHNIEVELSTENNRLNQLIAKQQDEADKLNTTKQARDALVAELGRGLQHNSTRLGELNEDTKRLQNLLASIREVSKKFSRPDRGAKKPFRSLKGHLGWPTKGNLVKRFGNKRQVGRWDGVLIEANTGESVRAISKGRIVYAEWLRGYGLLTIINHGRGYMSLYAFNESLYKEPGDWVETGDVIATVGQSAGRLQSGLYFGIRKDGKPLNPVKWCLKTKNGRIG